MTSMQVLSPEAMDYLHDLVPRTAARRHKIYPRPEKQDLEAALWLAACEEAEAYNEVATRGAKAIELRLKHAARRVQLAEEREQRARRAYAAGYTPADEAFYSLGQLRQLIPAYLDGGVSEHPPAGRAESAPVMRGQSSTYGDWPVVMMDIKAGLEGIPRHHRVVLEGYFSFPTSGPGRWTHEEIASRMGQPPEALRGRVYRALKALQDFLGGASPYVLWWFCSARLHGSPDLPRVMSGRVPRKGRRCCPDMVPADRPGRAFRPEGRHTPSGHLL